MWRLFIISLLGLTFYFSCAKKQDDATGGTFACQSTPVAKGLRQFGMDISDVASGSSYSNNLSTLQSLGGTFQTLHLNWNQIEASGSGALSGAFTDPYGGALASLNSIANSTGVKVTLRIHPVDIPGKSVPTDLSSARFNTANMKTRAKAMLDYVFTRISPSNVNQLLIGNEIDGYNPGADTNFWTDYPDFLNDVRTYINASYSVKVGFVTTLYGVTDSSKTLHAGGANSVSVFSAWMSVVDTIGVTYYPLDNSFQMRAASVVATDFQNLAAFTAKPIHIEEIGYASSAANSSSDYAQAEFFCEAFKAWDAHSTSITSLAILRMNDLSRASAETVATNYGLTGNEAFIEYIRSLGLRTNDAIEKNSVSVVRDELNKRGF